MGDVIRATRGVLESLDGLTADEVGRVLESVRVLYPTRSVQRSPSGAILAVATSEAPVGVVEACSAVPDARGMYQAEVSISPPKARKTSEQVSRWRDRALSLVATAGPEGMPATQVRDALGINRVKVWHLLMDLVDAGQLTTSGKPGTPAVRYHVVGCQ